MSKINDLIKELCPKGVIFKRLDDVCTKIYAGGTPSTSHEEYYGGNIKWLRSGEINFNELYDTEIKITEVGLNNSSAKIIPAHSVVIAMTGATVARTAMVMEEMSMNQSVCALIPKGELNYRFLYQLLANKYLELKQSGQGVLTSLNLDKIKKIVIPIPPIEVQNEIVRILDKFGELEAELEAELEVRKSQYEFWRGKVISSSYGRNGKLIELLSGPVTDGPHTTPQLVSEGIPFISASAVHEGKIHLEDAQGFITKEFDVECSKKYKPKKWDVYMVKSGSTTGKVAIVDIDDDFNIWSPLAAMRTNNEITSRYLYHLLQTKEIQEQVQNRMSHGSQPNLSMRVLEQFDVKIPTLKEQERIVNVLDKFDALVNDITVGIPAEIELRRQQYEYYRNKLLNFEELKAN